MDPPQSKKPSISVQDLDANKPSKEDAWADLKSLNKNVKSL